MVDTADAQKAGRMPVHATGYGAHICGFIPDSEQIPNIWVSSAFTQKKKVLKPLRFQDFYWSECNYRIWKNPVISMVSSSKQEVVILRENNFNATAQF